LSGNYGSHKAQIFIAILGLAGVIASGLLSNWDKLFGNGEKTVQISEIAESVAEINANAAEQNVVIPELSEPVAYLPASFDCAQAFTESEKIICSNSAISHVDGLLAEAYKEARSRIGEQAQQNLKLQQRRWIEHRDGMIALGCNRPPVIDVACVIKVYKDRIDELDSVVH